MLKFIDISAWQSDLVLSNLVGQIDGVMIKGTEGTGYVNASCDPWFQQAKRYGLKLGVYHFASTGDPKAEADYFIQHCGNYFNGNDAHAIPCLDWEGEQSDEWANEFLEYFHDKTKIWPWIYSYYSMFEYNPNINENCGRWVAMPKDGRMTFEQAQDYGVLDLVAGLDCAWQFTHEGRLAGYNGNLDLNVFYGDAEAWDKYALGETKQAQADVEKEMTQVLENDTYKVTIEVKKNG